MVALRNLPISRCSLFDCPEPRLEEVDSIAEFARSTKVSSDMVQLVSSTSVPLAVSTFTAALSTIEKLTAWPTFSNGPR